MIGRLLCRLGSHIWLTRTIVDEDGMVRTYMWCDRRGCVYEGARCHHVEPRLTVER